MPPRVHYAKSGDVHIAYQVIGDGPIDLVLSYGYGSNVDVMWEHPRRCAAFLDELAEMGRLVIYDKRDTGCSDYTGVPTALEQRVDDLRAVIDAVGSERCVLLGMTGGAPPTAMFTAMHPERVEALVLYAAVASFQDLAHRIGMQHMAEGPSQEFMDRVDDAWGRGVTAGLYARSMRHEPGFVEWCARFERAIAPPGNAAQMIWMSYQSDLERFLPMIAVPTLALWRPDDGYGTDEAYRHAANMIPGGRGVALPGTDHWPWVGDTTQMMQEIRSFLPARAGESQESRRLAAVLFTDIVGSTERSAAVGDRQWRAILDRHDALARTQIERFRGAFVKSTGDGALATFDGPARAVRCAHAFSDAVRELGIDVRAGVHMGEIEQRGDDVGGIAVHIASRVCGEATGGEVLVTRTVRELVVGSGLTMHERGSFQLKGVPEEWVLYAAST